MRKKLIIVLIILIIISLPFMLVSNFTLHKFQATLEQDKDKSWAPDWLMKLGSIYRWTFRDKEGIEVYKSFLERYPGHARYPEAKYWYAYCLEQAQQTKEAAREYEEFVEWYPDRPEVKECRTKIATLKYRQF
jgi:TolA-binding protein